MLIRGNFSDFFMETMLPALNTVTWKRFNDLPDYLSKVFDVQSNSRSIEQFSDQVSGWKRPTTS